MNDVKSFTIYKEYYELITLLNQKEQEELCLAILKYMFEDIEPVLNERGQKIFNNLKRPLISSKEQSKRRTKQEPKENQIETKQEPKAQPKENTSNDVNVNVNMSNVNVNKKRVGVVGGEKKKQYEQEFEELWIIYPNKKGKPTAMQKYSLAREQGTTYEEVRQGLEAYIKYCKIENIEPKYIKHASTWFNQKCWTDDYTIKRKMTTRDIQDKIDLSDFLGG